MNNTNEADQIKKELEELKEEYIRRSLISDEDIKYGRVTEIDDLEKESENW
ncbi:MAG: hypothetical protein IAF38_18650 [Bacteroidia bacterium]|nr:hypothetical protein [Bacteroidia bacterium]